MRRSLILLWLLLCIPSPSLRAQGVASSSLKVYSNLSGINTNDTVGCNANSKTSQTVYHLCYPDATIGGNSGLVACGWSNGTITATVSDDASSTYTSQIGPSRHSGGQDVQIWLASPIGTGAHQVPVTFSAAVTGVRCAVPQLFNINTSSPSCGTAVNGQSGGSTTVSAGSITSSEANCLYFQFDGEEDQFGAHPIYTVGSGWTFENADGRSGWASQTKINTSASAMPCSMTVDTAKSYNTSCVALRRDLAQGAAPTGMYVRSLAMFNLKDSSTSYVFQTPCTGNLLVWATNSVDTTTSVSSIAHANPGTSFSQVGTGIAGGEGVQQNFWDVQTWTNSTTSTLTMSNTNDNNNAMYYCIAGASATGQPDSSLATASGSCTNCSPITTITITPSSASGIMIATQGDALEHSRSGTPQGTQDNQDNNNHWTHFGYSSSSAQAFTVTLFPAATGPGNYSMAGAAFKAPAAGGATPAINKRAKLDKVDGR